MIEEIICFIVEIIVGINIIGMIMNEYQFHEINKQIEKLREEAKAEAEARRINRNE